MRVVFEGSRLPFYFATVTTLPWILSEGPWERLAAEEKTKKTGAGFLASLTETIARGGAVAATIHQKNDMLPHPKCCREGGLNIVIILRTPKHCTQWTLFSNYPLLQMVYLWDTSHSTVLDRSAPSRDRQQHPHRDPIHSRTSSSPNRGS